MKDKYNACILLHALGDTIGFKNGDWEFNRNTQNEFIKKKNLMEEEYTLEIVYEFIMLGGCANINLKGWNVSDDTILHICTIKTLLKEHKNVNNICKILRKYFIKAINESKKSKINRYYGETTIENIKKLEVSESNIHKLKYNIRYGGSGAAMKSLCIGLVYHGEKNRQKLIETTIEICRMTHNSINAYIGSLATAMFVSFAIEEIDIKEWSIKFVKVLESGIVDKYLKNTRNYDDYIMEKPGFINAWKDFNDSKFDKQGNIIKYKNDRNLVKRMSSTLHTGDDEKIWPGGDSFTAIIFAYSSLLDCDSIFDTLIFYSMLHYGDSDTIGCIAAGLYGAYYGFKNIHVNLLKHLEFKDELLGLSDRLYNKFYKK
tara:strand:- start:497 stop:1615 length:1119 start_codon:yes stop_codon:yes gene_type:complete